MEGFFGLCWFEFLFVSFVFLNYLGYLVGKKKSYGHIHAMTAQEASWIS